jgi:(2Fe-2S) ferredoxin
MPTPHLTAVAESLGIGTATHHVFLCAGASKAKCCPADDSLEVWDYLKGRIGELGLTGQVLRTKADCLRICTEGPICVVYPEGVWYHSVTIPVMEKILTEHVQGGTPVEAFVIARAPLGSHEAR